MSEEYAFDRLVEIQDQMEEMIRETEQLMRENFRSEYVNAEVYWIAHIKNALGGMGYHTHSSTFLSALNSIEGKEDTYNEDEEDLFDRKRLA